MNKKESNNSTQPEKNDDSSNFILVLFLALPTMGLSSPRQRYRLPEWKEIQAPKVYRHQETHFIFLKLLFFFSLSKRIEKTREPEMGQGQREKQTP